MRVIVVDDMLSARKLMSAILEEITDVELVASFGTAEEAMRFLKENEIDIIFLDVVMPGMTGIEMAHALEAQLNPSEIIFVTGHAEYALDAWRTNAHAYILKPFVREDIERAIARCMLCRRSRDSEKKVEIRCFPGFDVFLDGEPIRFKSAKSKELLAYLVQNRGEWVKSEKLTYILFGDKDEKTSQAHLRVIFHRLRGTLKEHNLAELLETSFNQSRVRTELFECDYYRYLSGRKEEFHGEYLHDYSWGEPVLSLMLREYGKM